MNFYLERAHSALDHTLTGLAGAELTRRSQPGKWCVAEILEHLALTYSGTAKAMQRCLESGRPIARKDSMREFMARTLVVNLGYMPSGRSSPEMVRPRGTPPDTAVPMLQAEFARMEDMILQCVRRFGAKVKLANHPILGPLNATEWSKFHWVHTRHHMKQIARIRGQRELQSSS